MNAYGSLAGNMSQRSKSWASGRMTSANSAVSSMNWTMESWKRSFFSVSAMAAGSWLFSMWFVRPWIIASGV